MESKILEAINSPKGLEILFRENPEEFRKEFPSVLASHPESIILQVWQERLNLEPESEKRQVIPAWSFKNIIILLLLTAIAGTIYKLPDFFDSIDRTWFYTRNMSLIFIVPLMAYFVQRTKPTRLPVLIFLITASTLLYLNLLPSPGDKWYEFRDIYTAFYDAFNQRRNTYTIISVAIDGCRLCRQGLEKNIFQDGVP